VLDFWRALAHIGLHPVWVWTIRLSLPAYVLWIVAWFWFGLPWFLSPMMALAGLVGWFLHVSFRRPPTLDPHPREATVTGHTTEVIGEFGSRRPVIHMRVETPDGTFDSVLADRIADVDRNRFARGSRWTVRTFAGSTARVMLSDTHDVRRTGYDLDGVRMAEEHRSAPARRGWRR